MLVQLTKFAPTIGRDTAVHADCRHDPIGNIFDLGAMEGQEPKPFFTVPLWVIRQHIRPLLLAIFSAA